MTIEKTELCALCGKPKGEHYYGWATRKYWCDDFHRVEFTPQPQVSNSGENVPLSEKGFKDDITKEGWYYEEEEIKSIQDAVNFSPPLTPLQFQKYRFDVKLAYLRGKFKEKEKILNFIEKLREHKGEGGRLEHWETITFDLLIKKLKEFWENG